MRDFSWNYFSITGDVHAYLLYKRINSNMDEDGNREDVILEREDEADN